MKPRRHSDVTDFASTTGNARQNHQESRALTGPVLDLQITAGAFDGWLDHGQPEAVAVTARLVGSLVGKRNRPANILV